MGSATRCSRSQRPRGMRLQQAHSVRALHLASRAAWAPSRHDVGSWTAAGWKLRRTWHPARCPPPPGPWGAAPRAPTHKRSDTRGSRLEVRIGRQGGSGTRLEQGEGSGQLLCCSSGLRHGRRSAGGRCRRGMGKKGTSRITGGGCGAACQSLLCAEDTRPPTCPGSAHRAGRCLLHPGCTRAGRQTGLSGSLARQTRCTQGAGCLPAPRWVALPRPAGAVPAQSPTAHPRTAGGEAHHARNCKAILVLKRCPGPAGTPGACPPSVEGRPDRSVGRLRCAPGIGIVYNR